MAGSTHTPWGLTPSAPARRPDALTVDLPAYRLPLAILLGTYTAVSLARASLYRLIPSRLEGDAVTLRLRIWRTWNGLLTGFRRTDARMPREHIVGVAIGHDQGRNAQLFLVHCSGQHFYAGFTGDLGTLERTGAAIQSWIGEARA